MVYTEPDAPAVGLMEYGADNPTAAAAIDSDAVTGKLQYAVPVGRREVSAKRRLCSQ